MVAAVRPAYDGAAVCVTGGAGFIGSHLVESLLTLGSNVTVIDDLSSSTLEHLAGMIELDPQRLNFIHASILEDSALREGLAEARVVFHLAALGSVPRSLEEPERAFAVNGMGTTLGTQAGSQFTLPGQI